MDRRTIITPEYLSEARARENVKLHAYRLFAFTNAIWPEGFDFSYIEEEIRETLINLAISLRRLIQLLKIEKGVLAPMNIKSVLSDEDVIPYEIDLYSTINTITHLEALKCYIDFSDGHQILHLSIRSDERFLTVDPSALVEGAFAVLEMPQTEFPWPPSSQ